MTGLTDRQRALAGRHIKEVILTESPGGNKALERGKRQVRKWQKSKKELSED